MSESNVLNVTTRDSVEVKSGIDTKVREQLAKHLSLILADNYVLTIKSHIYHWNVVGPLFKPIHDLTEEHYEDLFEASDVIAERIRALGHQAPMNAGEIDLKLSIPTPSKSMPSAHDMIADLVKHHETISAEMRDLGAYAGDNGDLVTEDLMTARITFHEKAAWMLRAMLAE